ncbi:hypothetical protein GWI33_021766 [Rhynchophorus ferrugineus]|uniref:Uncharacterized protein n=1 Tax=Rhynchophorus ferrugineus TaxID=354439 RepID=A0A834IVH8_RHYFE|nr:hypothetical protein GWI33_021766 [Rhynchophorus ferrugineus]
MSSTRLRPSAQYEKSRIPDTYGDVTQLCTAISDDPKTMRRRTWCVISMARDSATTPSIPPHPSYHVEG